MGKHIEETEKRLGKKEFAALCNGNEIQQNEKKKYCTTIDKTIPNRECHIATTKETNTFIQLCHIFERTHRILTKSG